MYEYRGLTPEQRAELVKERLVQGYPPHSPPHHVHGQQSYLLTATCYEHSTHMHTGSRRRQVLDGLFEALITAGMEIRAWVVLPNHYHLVVHGAKMREVGQALRLVHGPTARQWNEQDDTPGRQVWYRFVDRAIRSERHYYTTLNYIHYNPVKHGWVGSPYSWTESSVHWYLHAYGREWLRDLWVCYPIRSYGERWDRG